MSLPLSDSDRTLLARVIMEAIEPLTEELLEGALEALRHRSQLAQRERDIKQGIFDAERRNDMATYVRLKQELLELDRRLAASMS
jgi:hypothetical protein